MHGIILVPKTCFNGEEFYLNRLYIGDGEE